MAYPELCQIEIHVSDRKRAEKFYEEALGWKFVPAEILSYSVVEVEPESKFGIALVSGVAPTSNRGAMPSIYFKCNSPEALKERVIKSGGSIVPASRSMPGGGIVFTVVDPDGNRIGFYSAANV
jgi:predicted enzyme related to lactoylglutathione lyase